MLREETTTIIPCKLGEAEIRQRGCDLAGELENIEALIAEKKTATRQFAERSQELAAKVARLREVVKTGIEAIEQPCEKVFDFENRLVWWELSDGTQYHKREMRDDELGKATRNIFDIASENEEEVF